MKVTSSNLLVSTFGRILPRSYLLEPLGPPHRGPVRPCDTLGDCPPTLPHRSLCSQLPLSARSLSPTPALPALSGAANALGKSLPAASLPFYCGCLLSRPLVQILIPNSFFLEVTPQTSCGVSLQRLRLHGSLLFKWLKWLPTISGSEFKPLAM